MSSMICSGPARAASFLRSASSAASARTFVSPRARRRARSRRRSSRSRMSEGTLTLGGPASLPGFLDHLQEARERASTLRAAARSLPGSVRRLPESFIGNASSLPGAAAGRLHQPRPLIVLDGFFWRIRSTSSSGSDGKRTMWQRRQDRGELPLRAGADEDEEPSAAAAPRAS